MRKKSAMGSSKYEYNPNQLNDDMKKHEAYKQKKDLTTSESKSRQIYSRYHLMKE